MIQTNWLSHSRASPWWPMIAWLGPVFATAGFLLQTLLLLRDMFARQSSSDLVNFCFQAVSAICFVTLLAQATLAGLYLGWGSGKFWARFSIVWASIFIVVACWGCGYLVAPKIVALFRDPSIDTTDLTRLNFYKEDVLFAVQLLAAIPTMSLGFQLPFWLTRIVFGWRLRHCGEESADSSPRNESLSIANLMVAIAIVALYIGVMQLAFRASDSEAQEESIEAVFGVLACAGIGSLFTGLLSLPQAWVFLTWQRPLIAVLASVAKAMGVTCLLYVVVYLTGSEFTWQVVLGLAIMSMAYVGVVTLGLCLWRWHGWTISRGRIESVRPAASTAEKVANEDCV